MIHHVAKSIAAAIVISSVAAAADLNPAWIGADAEWVAHFNIEHARESHLGRFMLDHPDTFDFLEDLAEFEGETGINVIEDATGITLYGIGEQEADALVIVTMNDAIDDLITSIENAEEYHLIAKGGHDMHAWIDDDETVYVYISDTPHGTATRTVILGESVAMVLQGVRVYHGELQNITAVKSRLAVGPKPGSLVYAAAIGVPWLEDEDDPASAVLRQSDHVSIQFGEAGANAYIDLSVAARDEFLAENITTALQGLLALGRLMAHHNEELAPMAQAINAISIQPDGNTINANLTCDREKFTETLQAVMGHHEHHHNRHDHDHSTDDGTSEVIIIEED